jgi:cell division protein FtsI (penicillin-binding protein 3)
MKVFTVAAALAGGALKPTEAIYCEHGSYELGGVKIHDTHVNDWLTPTQVLAKSSNIGALKIGLNLGEPALYSAFRRFGFGEVTGLPLPGEASGVLRPKGRPWFDVETANASFGQGISVTTIQLAMAMAAIANGGRLMEPVLVRRVTDARGTVIRENAPRLRREVVSPGVAKLLSEMLTAVAEDGGTGVEARLAGHRVAGKTATAQKVDPQTGKYSEEKYTASFVGFVPADKPRLVIAVVLDEPMIGHYGGDLAGPVFRRVAESSLRYLGVVPHGSTPNLTGLKPEEDPAQDVAMAFAHAKDPVPEGAAPMPIGPPSQVEVRVPDALGLTAREAMRTFAGAGLVPQIEGSGKLVRQNPAAGTPVPRGSSVRLVFEPGT